MINELRKAIDDYWASKRKTYRTGRIKRMRGIPNNRWSRIFKRIGLKRYTLILNMNDDLFDKTMFGITRWNKH